MEAALFNKLDSDLKDALEERQLDEQVRFLITTTHQIEEPELEHLEEKGCRVTSNFGNVVTGFAPLRCLAEVSRFNFVRHIDLARKLTLE